MIHEATVASMSALMLRRTERLYVEGRGRQLERKGPSAQTWPDGGLRTATDWGLHLLGQDQLGVSNFLPVLLGLGGLGSSRKLRPAGHSVREIGTWR